MTTALYRRYRPQAFGEMIGQSQVTEPLMTALRGDRVGHAYLFSGPRGCGKTTSARILARCLNCAAGPTDTPCGTCDSCVELGRGGGGSLDVVEIDAASHNGVDDARDLRERAIFAPARDRFKIFILDEAHMVTQQGFNALLKLVEEPPAHVKFIFATTEPEKVLGTIRSRTHHYPFRLVPPAAMLEYVQELCETEGVGVEAGVLPLVVRAGGGSPRDTLSLLDQLIAGSDVDATGSVLVRYERAVALLGYTHSELLDEVVDAFSAEDAGAAFSAVDRVIQTGQDPRRFVDDLLERLRDLIVVAATGAGASAVLRGIPEDELERMGRQAGSFGAARLSRTADLTVAALDEMTGATSPRLQLELLVARVLAHAGSAGVAPAAATAPTVTAAPAAPPTARTEAPSRPAPATNPRVASPGVAAPVAAPAVASPSASPNAAPRVASPGVASPAAAPPVASPNAAPRVASPGIASPAAAAPNDASRVASPTAPSRVAAPTAGPDAASPARGPRDTAPAGDLDDIPPLSDDDAPAPDDEPHPFDVAPTEEPPAARPAAGAPGRDDAASSQAPAAPQVPVTAQTPQSPASAQTPQAPPAAQTLPAEQALAAAQPPAVSPAEKTPSASPAASAPAGPAATEPAPSSEEEAGPFDPSPPTPPAPPTGPLELPQVRDSWPEVLEQLEVLSRPSWLVVSTASVAAFEVDVLTLAFRSPGDLTAFKTRVDGAGPSEDLRQAIQTVLGIRVKYLARLEGDAGPGGPGAPPAGGAPRGGGSTPPSGGGRAEPRATAAYSSAPVTEWAVAPIPSSDGTAGAPQASRASVTTAERPPVAPALAVDDEPDETPAAAVVAVREGAVLPATDVTPSVAVPEEREDDDVIPPADEQPDAPVPPVVVPRMAPLAGGVQRYGEAVVRQMLGAVYVRDEPYEPPARFS
ncbi:DNA polymerase III subunit gamma and tau [Microbacterium sp. LMI1-1-1.1]|uniref:DNA polymerase III subunit gamma and tau n=1 Tax=Microbacterium sp. LMI1-1-1.1 TaxID=3135223 RepID=UPI003465E918